jgi:hypothetical protein
MLKKFTQGFENVFDKYLHSHEIYMPYNRLLTLTHTTLLNTDKGPLLGML